MIKVSTKPTALLAALFVLGTTAYSQTQDWPLKRNIDISSGFGDFRANRFHAGVDLRTGGAVGAKIYSPVDGYVWRAKMSYRGYGKGLYVKGTDDHFYVFAHLSRFNDVIDAAVRDEQFRQERYYVDIYLPEDSIPVKKGQLIGYSGQTGIGAPHLHFEKRSPDNIPINPLSHGFTLNDSVPPTFERIGFHLLDNHSLFPNGRRKMFLPVTRVAPGRYELDTILNMTGPFGVLAHCYDQKRVGGMRQAVQKLTLYLDGIPEYEVVFDSLPFAVGPMADLAYDPLEAANGEKRVRRLYHLYDRLPDMRWAMGSMDGLIDSKNDHDSSPHLLRIEATDHSGNVSTLGISFRVSESRGAPGFIPPADDESWSGYDVTERGVAVGLIGPEPGTDRNVFLYENPSVQGRLTHKPTLRILDSAPDSLSLHYLEDGDTAVADDYLALVMPVGGLFKPRWVAIERRMSAQSPGPDGASRLYLISPEAFPVRKEFQVSIKLDPGVATNPHTGLCWYDKKEDEWVWIDEETENDDLAAGPSLGGGLFAAIIDTTAPTITKLNLKQGHKYWNRQPRVKCLIEDNLSGFENDLSIDCRVDGEYILPELDTEDGDFVGLMPRPLSLGQHVLTIAVTDRAGNRTERQVEFDVIKRSN